MQTSTENNNLLLYLEGRIDTSNAGQTEQEIFSALDKTDKTPAFDAGKLTYISSAGLRVLLKVSKSFKEKLVIENVSEDVYDIFNTTGFTELFDVKAAGDINTEKPMREISIEGKEKIGITGLNTVYRLDDETVVKVYLPSVNYDIHIKKEQENARNAFVAGVPAVIPFDVVKVGDSYGLVYEMQNCRMLWDVMIDDKAHLEDYTRRYAQTIKKVHSIKANKELFSSSKALMLSTVKKLSGLFVHDEIEKFIRLIENIPERDTFLINNCYPNNAILQNDELLLVNFGVSGYGHPITDVSNMYMRFCHDLSFRSESERKIISDITEEERKQIWKTFISEYLGTIDKQLLEKTNEQIRIYSFALRMFAYIGTPGELSDETFGELKNEVMSYIDKGIEPLCF